MDITRAKGQAATSTVAPEWDEIEARSHDELLAIIAHELRGPLGAIRVGIDALSRGADDPAMRKQTLSLLNRQARLMTDLLESLLDLSRITQGKASLRKQPVELAQLVETTLEIVRPRIDGRAHRLDVTLPKTPVILHVDRTRMQEVLTNLLENAAKYTTPGGRIHLSATLEADAVVLQVRDNGIGIGADTLPHVFDLFHQSARAADHCQGGLGIGLALVRRIIEMHGGAVWALSAGIGKGSEFVVRLPR